MLTNHWYWRPGWGVGKRYLVWYLTWEDHAEVRAHAAAHQRALAPLDELDLVPETWLHLTLQCVGPAGDYTEADVAQIVEAAHRRLGRLDPPTAHFDRPEPLREAIAFPVSPREGLDDIRDAARQGTIEALGEARLQDQWPRPRHPHVSVAYVARDISRAVVHQALGTVHIPPVETVVRHASLVELHRDDNQYEWRTVARVPVGDG